ncbi:MAG: glycosyltransferase family 87 protein [Terriglobales bacterium]
MTNSGRLRGWVFATVLLWMAIANIYVLWESRTAMAKGYFDFANFYTAGALVDRGLGAEIYDHEAQWKVQQEFASEVKIRLGPMRYLRPPFEALLFAVFAMWPYPKALLLWTIFKLALLAAIPFVVIRGRPWRESFPIWLIPVLVLGTIPGFMDVLLGQDAVLIAFLFAVVFWQLDVGRDWVAGIVLGLALCKFQLALPFVLAVAVAGRRRVLPGFAISAFALTVVSFFVVGWKGLVNYPAYLLALNQSAGVGIAPQLQMTLRGLLTFIVGRLPYPGRIHWVLAPIALAAIVYAGLIWRKAGSGFLAEGFGLAALVGIVTSYYAYSYDLLLLIVPLIAMRTRPDDAPRADRATRLLERVGLFFVLFTPTFWFVNYLHDQCLMTLPLLALIAALVRRLHAGGRVSEAGHTLVRDCVQ